MTHKDEILRTKMNNLSSRCEIDEIDGEICEIDCEMDNLDQVDEIIDETVNETINETVDETVDETIDETSKLEVIDYTCCQNY
ncbi:hypothetical protein Glove_86g111 [Diversispora epigaea]|uniref:Uncharacterized protein n=1 Tax=Diversispora epigaea TaxID=1348612 RepID=A0A397JFH5_9GLOM|nr:hypothetical protein Glove_86g111 [Diversispora epigaea]